MNFVLNARDLADMLDEHVTYEAKLTHLKWVKNHCPKTVFEEMLALYYDVWAFPVTGEGPSEGCDPAEIGQFFVCTNFGEFEGSHHLPVHETSEACYHFICQALELETLFYRECETKKRQPRDLPDNQYTAVAA